MGTNERLNAISFFSGSGMLDRGAAAAFARIGINLRIIAYIEREKACQEVILARQRDGLLDAGQCRRTAASSSSVQRTCGACLRIIPIA